MMHKIGTSGLRHEEGRQVEPGWLSPAAVASIEVSSEHPDYPVESVLAFAGPGWCAAEPGEQSIRIVFDRLRSLRRIRLEFSESERERTQEFALRAAATPSDLSRRSFDSNFSPRGATTEMEDYLVTLFNVLVLELTLKPDVAGHDIPATLDRWQVA